MIRKEDWLVLSISLSFLLLPLALFYAELPHIQRGIPIHWGLSGPDRFVTPEQFPFLVLLLAGLMGLVWGVRFVYPLRQNVEKFRKAYNTFVVLISLLLAILLSGSVLWSAGVFPSLRSLVWGVVGVALVAAGVLMYASKRNWAVGFRNPWTLSSDQVWESVNRKAGVLTSVVGALFLASGLLNGDMAVWMLALLLLGYVVLTVYSYVLWRREH